MTEDEDGSVQSQDLTSGANDEKPSDKVANDENTNRTKPDPIDVRMIDFAHVFPTTSTDENYNYGLNNLIRNLRKLLSD